MHIRWEIAAGGGGFMVLGLLALRYGGENIAPLLDDPRAARDSTTAPTAVTDSARVALASADTSSTTIRQGPFVIDGMAYTVQIQRDTGSSKSKDAARRGQVGDSTGRVVYDENLFLRSDSTSSESWIVFQATALEDATGRARGFEFGY